MESNRGKQVLNLEIFRMNMKTMVSFGFPLDHEELYRHSSNNYVTYASISFIGETCLTSIAWRAWPARAIILLKKNNNNIINNNNNIIINNNNNNNDNN